MKTLRFHTSLSLFLPGFLMITLLLSSCAAPERTTERETGDPEDPVLFDFSEELVAGMEEESEEAVDLRRLSPEERTLYETRSRLAHQFDTWSHDMPEFYLQEVARQEIDPNQGLRIQILSTRDVSEADSTVAQFERWAREIFAEYVPHAYIRFRPPFYRVRVGDFHDRERASELSRMLKSKYPDAWVIHDQVNPYRVPADTVRIRFLDPSERTPQPDSGPTPTESEPADNSPQPLPVQAP